MRTARRHLVQMIFAGASPLQCAAVPMNPHLGNLIGNVSYQYVHVVASLAGAYEELLVGRQRKTRGDIDKQWVVWISN